MTDRYPLGALIELEFEIRDETGVLMNTPNPIIAVKSPSDVETVYAPPDVTNPSIGIIRVVIIGDEDGKWVAVARDEVNGGAGDDYEFIVKQSRIGYTVSI